MKARKKNFNTIVLDNTYSAFEEKAQFTIESDFIYRRDKMWIENIIHFVQSTEEKWKFIPARKVKKQAHAFAYVSSKRIIAMLSPDNLCYYDNEIEEAWDAEDMHSQQGFGIRRKSYYHYIRVLGELCEIPV